MGMEFNQWYAYKHLFIYLFIFYQICVLRPMVSFRRGESFKHIKYTEYKCVKTEHFSLTSLVKTFSLLSLLQILLWTP